MLPISRLPLQAPRLRATTFRVLRTDLARSSTYIASPQLKLCRNSYSFRTIFTKSSPRGAEPASTATQPSKPNATSSPPSSETLPAPPTAQAFAVQDDDPSNVDWTRSFHGLSAEPFSKEAADILMAPLSPDDVEIKPDGIVYLPEIKYRRILNRAFGPGGWGLAPRGETIVTEKAVTREYALLAHGR